MCYALTFLAVFLGILGAVAAGNIGVDLDGRFRQAYAVEREAAAILSSGRNLAGNRALNIPAMRFFTMARSPRPAVLVLGSSRAMEVQAGMAGGATLANVSIDSAGLAEYTALLAGHFTRAGDKSTVLIGADPWIFLRQDALALNLLPFRDLLAGPPAAEIAAALDLSWPGRGEVWRSAVSLPRFRESIQVLAKPRQDPACGRLIPIGNEDSPCSLWRADGSYRYPPEFAARLPNEILAEVRLSHQQRGRIHAFTGHSELDRQYVQGFGQMLDWIMGKGARAAIFLPPFHPELERGYADRHDWALVREAEAEIRQSAAARGIAVAGSFSAAAAGCTPAEFFDAIHPRPTCIARIVTPLLKSAAERALSVDRRVAGQ